MAGPDVFVVGALHLDVVVNAERFPQLDETLMGEAVAYRFGGKGGNQALAAARMGASVAMAGRVGEDSFAAVVEDTLRASGVDHSQVLRVPGATGMSVAIVEEGGEYGAVVVSGVNQTIDPDEVDVGAARVVLLQHEIPDDVNLAVMKKLGEDRRIILNAAPARWCSRDLLKNVDVLVANRLEALQLLESDGEGLEALARGLKSVGSRSVVVTAGKEGAVLVDEDGAHWITPPVQSEGSAHGAGDAFVGALAAEIAQGADLKSATEFAALSAAHFVQVPPDERTQITRGAVLAWSETL